MSEPIQLTTNKTDAEKAAAYRIEMAAALEPVVDILNRARKDGLIIGWNIGADEFGRMRIPPISITKPL